MFNIVSVFVLVYSPRDIGRQFSSPTPFKIMVFLNISTSLISATLVSISLDVFEVSSHELEYANELTMAFIDAAMIMTMIRSRSQSRLQLAQWVGFAVAAVGICIAIVQLAIYNGMGWTDGRPNGETAAHYFEFSFGMMVGTVTASFAFDNKFRCDSRLEELTQPVCGDCSGSCGSDAALKQHESGLRGGEP